MADQKTNDTELETYLEGKSPLSNLYRQSEATGPSKHIDDAILNAARQHTAETTKHSHRWYVPIALVASLIVAVVVVRIVPFNTPESEQLAENDKPSSSGQHVGASKATPEIMLEKINQLVKDGEKKKAKQEYELFIELFPRHKIDFKRYPGIKTLEKSKP